MSTPPITISRDDLASPWHRLAAVLVDGLILMPLTLVLIFLVAADGDLRIVWWFTPVFAAYQIVGIALRGQTVGKHAVDQARQGLHDKVADTLVVREGSV